MNRPVDAPEGIPFGWFQAGSVYPSPDKSHRGKDWLAVKQPCGFRESGVIVFSGLLGELGSYVQMQADSDAGRFWGLAHLSRRDVAVGQIVAAGEAVGLTGGVPGEYGAGLSDGPHLHEECRVGWQWGERIDPDSVVLENAMTDKQLETIEQAFWDLKQYLEGPQTKVRRADLSAKLLTAVRKLKGEE